MSPRLPFKLGRRAEPADDIDDDADWVDDGGTAGRWAPPGPAAAPPSPTRMTGREVTQGYAVAVVLFVVGVIDLVVRHGAGAPPHENLWFAWVGLVLSVAVAATMPVRNRLLSPLLAIVSAFFVTTVRGPNAVSIPHVVALIVAFLWAVLLSTRQRREQRALTGTPARGGGRRGRRGAEPEPEAGPRTPTANRRYTPPKARSSDSRSRRR